MAATAERPRTEGPAEGLLDCDLIMKGGVTSGIVYPPAVLELQKRYRFRHIGGTSAGAIAAALTAAAEYNRAGGGFEHLRRASDELAQEGRLLGLFQPSAETRPLFDTLLELTRQGKTTPKGKEKKPEPGPTPEGEKRETGRVGRRMLALNRSVRASRKTASRTVPAAFRPWAARGAAIGALIALIVWLAAFWSVWRAPLWLSIPLGAILAGFVIITSARLTGLLGAILHLKTIALTEVPRNFYGLCNGLTSPGCDHPALTDWLHATIQQLAGRSTDDPPLTFGDLTKAGITLQMVTTNLSHGQPYGLPFQSRDFLFAESDFERLFPKSVVAFVHEHRHQSRKVNLKALEDVHFLPDWEKLPILVAARMSLSFPVLLSAVPLYSLRRSVFNQRRVDGVLVLEGRDDVQKNWFSDGGIASNFPIHFFDAWLPRSPTFGINLTEMPDEALEGDLGTPPEAERLRARFQSAAGVDDPEEEAEETIPDEPQASDDPEIERSVYLPKPQTTLYAEWEPVEGLVDFVGAIWKSASTFRDTTQAMLPSYRERVVQIRFSEDEGGLNLAMSRAAIDRIREKGRLAGTRFEAFEMKHHQWVRLRVIMAQLEAKVREARRAYPTFDLYEELLALQSKSMGNAATKFPYSRNVDWCEKASRRLQLLHTFIEAWTQEEGSTEPGPGERRGFFSVGVPKPEGDLRIIPRL